MAGLACFLSLVSSQAMVLMAVAVAVRRQRRLLLLFAFLRCHGAVLFDLATRAVVADRPRSRQVVVLGTLCSALCARVPTNKISKYFSKKKKCVSQNFKRQKKNWRERRGEASSTNKNMRFAWVGAWADDVSDIFGRAFSFFFASGTRSNSIVPETFLVLLPPPLLLLLLLASLINLGPNEFSC
jgi:hypothetical protein